MNLTRTLIKLVVLSALVVAGSYGIVFYRDHYSADHEIAQLQIEKHQLQQVVKRLSDEHRVADVLVTGRSQTPAGVKTTLLFVEYAKDGSTLPPKSFTIDGDEVHIDAMVIKFDHGFVEQGDAMRGHSIALFTRLYGSTQSPDHAFPIDTPGKIPDYYRGDDPVVTSFEQELWQNFWKLADDPAYAKEKGVRIANGQGLWGPFAPDKLYTITLESGGGLNLTSEPLKGIYKELLKKNVM